MNCRSVRRRLSEYLDGEVPAPRQAAIAAHLEVCAGCRDELEAMRRAGEALKTLSAVEAAPDLTGDLRRRLAAPAARRLRVGWVGAAAVAAVGIAIGCLLWLSPPEPAPRPAPTQSHTFTPEVRAERSEPVAPLVVEEPERLYSHSRHRSAPQVSERVVDLARQTPSVEVVEAPATEASLRDQSDDLMFLPSRAAPVEKPVPRFGVILLLGEPEPVLPSSRCYLEVSFPDGAKSIVDQSVERDAAGEPRVVQLSYQQVSPKTESLKQGG